MEAGAVCCGEREKTTDAEEANSDEARPPPVTQICRSCLRYCSEGTRIVMRDAQTISLFCSEECWRSWISDNVYVRTSGDSYFTSFDWRRRVSPRGHRWRC